MVNQHKQKDQEDQNKEKEEISDMLQGGNGNSTLVHKVFNICMFAFNDCPDIDNF